MNIFYENLINDNLDENLFKKHRELINFDVIEFLHKNNKNNYLKFGLKYLSKEYDCVNRYFIHQENFLDYFNYLNKYNKFFDLSTWNWIKLDIIPLQNLKFIQENCHRFKYKLNNNDKYYLNLLLNLDTTNIELNNDFSIQEIINFHLKNKNYEAILNLISRYDKFNFIKLFKIFKNDLENLKWISQQLNINDLNEDNIFDLFDITVTMVDEELLKWFIQHFIYFIPFNYVFTFICKKNNVTMLRLIHEFNSNIIEQNVENINYNSLHCLNLEIFLYLYENFNLNHDPLMVWQMFMNANNKMEFINMFHQKFKDFDWKLIENNFHNDYLMLNDKNLIDFCKEKNILIYQNYINELLGYSILNKNKEMILYYLKEYKNNIDFEKLESQYNFIIYEVDILKFIEQEINLPISIYDFLMQINSKYGEIEMMNYIQKKIEKRYEIYIVRYYYDVHKHKYIRIYDVNVNMILNHFNHDCKQECTICLENKDKMIKTNCNHIYCDECYDHWFKIKNNHFKCAYCRQKFHSIDIFQTKSNNELII